MSRGHLLPMIMLFFEYITLFAGTSLFKKHIAPVVTLFPKLISPIMQLCANIHIITDHGFAVDTAGILSASGRILP